MFFLKKILDYFFPRFCPICQELLKGPENVCSQDLERIVFFTANCNCCGKPFNITYELAEELNYLCGECRDSPPIYDSARALGPYEGVLKELIHKYKYGKKRFLYKEFGKLLVKENKRLGLEKGKFDQVIPVPLHWRKVVQRGFDQSFLLAGELSKYLEVPITSDNLFRNRFTSPQINLDRKKRKENIQNAFAVKNPEELMGQRILLVDDVLTTGATISECGKTLRSAGVKSIAVITLARAM